MRRLLFSMLVGGVALVPASAAEAVTGQVTCSACWSEADRDRVPYGGEADRACARRCAADGIAQAIAVRADDGTFALLTLRGGPPAPHGSWLDLVGEFVRAETEPARGDARRVTALEVLDGSPWPPPSDEPVAVGELSWPDLTGTPQSLDAYRGRVAVVNFWATWCEPCIEEIPLLAAVQADYAALGVQVVGIAADAPGRAGEVLTFSRQAGVTFPVWLGATTADMAALGVGPALPATVVLDREGRVVYRVVGVVEDDALRRHLDALLLPSGRPEPRASAVRPGQRHAHAGGRPGEAALVPS